MKIDDRVKFKSNAAFQMEVLDGRMGTIEGIASYRPEIINFIVHLDKSFQGHKAFVIPESCLTVIPSKLNKDFKFALHILKRLFTAKVNLGRNRDIFNEKGERIG